VGDEKNMFRIVELTIPFETTLDDAAVKSWSRVHSRNRTMT